MNVTQATNTKKFSAKLKNKRGITMQQMKTTNKNAKSFVREKKPFRASNLEGLFIGDCYVVLSYGWYPLFVWTREEGWICNTERYSVSTSKQSGQCHPGIGEIKQCMDHQSIKNKIPGFDDAMFQRRLESLRNCA